MNDKYKHSPVKESILSFKQSDGYNKFIDDMQKRAEHLQKQMRDCLNQHKDREAGEKLQRYEELKFVVSWFKNN